MNFSATAAAPDQFEWMRTYFRFESRHQIVHDSLHARPGWTITYLLYLDDRVAGYGSIAVAGPWTDRPTVFEFFLLPEFQRHTFRLFEVLLQASGAKHFEVQSNHVLLTAMLFRYASNIRSESIVFYDHSRTSHSIDRSKLECQTSKDDIQLAIERRKGGGEWLLIVDGHQVGFGGIMFHYNLPYGDIYMETAEPYRQRGYGSFLVQELKQICYELGVVPAARCNPANVASQRTLQKAGFAPYAHILDGELPT